MAWLLSLVVLAGSTQALDDSPFRVGPPDEIEACAAKLAAQSIRFRPASIPIHWNKTKTFQCGAAQIVRYHAGPEAITWRGAPKTSCPLALAMADFERIVQAEAAAKLHRKVRSIRHAGTYNCREMAAYPGWVSEHSYANAIDISSFVLQNGKEIKIGRDYASNSPAGRFLRAVARRAFDEGVFSVVLTPNFDGLHRHHLHLDAARYRVNGT
jgi:hypothetical protein